MAGWAYDPNKYAQNLKNMGASIKPTPQPMSAQAAYRAPGVGVGAAAMGSMPPAVNTTNQQRPPSGQFGGSGAGGGVSASVRTPRAYTPPAAGAIPQAQPKAQSGSVPGLGAAGAVVNKAASGFTGGNLNNGYAIQPGSQASHTGYINKTVPGGIKAYSDNNIARFRRGEISYGALQKDADRVGYGIPNQWQETDTVADPNPAPTEPAPVDYAALARSEMQAELDKMLRNAEAEKASLTAAYDRDAQITGEKRTMDRLWLDRNLSPFAGNDVDKKEGVARDWNLSDESIRNNYLANVAGVDGRISDFQGNFDEAVKQRAYELEQIALGNARADAGLTGTFNGAPTLDAKSLSFNQDMATKQFERGAMESDRDYNYRIGQQGWENMFREKQFSEDKASRLWEQTFQEKSFAQNVKEAAASRGLQWASLGQRQKEFVADSAFREKQFKLEENKFKASNGAASNEKMTKEKQGLVTAIRSGEVTPSNAMKQIYEDTQLGFYTQAEAQELMDALKVMVGSPTPPSQVAKDLIGEMLPKR